MEYWYALYTKPHKEQQVGGLLQSKGLETYLPTVKIRRNGHCKVEPLFSCYLFLRVDGSDGFSSLRWTPGLRGIVSFGDHPAVVDDDVVSCLRQRLPEMQQSAHEACRFKPGDKLEITSGPLKHLEAVFEQGLSSGQRARILVDFLGRWTRCEVETDHLEKVR